MALNSNQGIILNARYDNNGYGNNNLTKTQFENLKKVREGLHGIKGAQLPKSKFNFLKYGNLPSKYNVDNLIDNLGKLNNIVTNGGEMIGIDLETLGDVFGKTQIEKDLFSVTEIGLLKQKVKKVNGQMVVEQLKGVNYAIGIDYTTKLAIEQLLARYKNANFKMDSFTDVEKSTLERLSVYSGVFGDIFKKTGNFYEVVGQGQTSHDINKMIEGLNNLFTLNKKYGVNFKSNDKSSIIMKILNEVQGNLIESNNPNNLLFGFNSSGFDIPRINEVFQMHGMSKLAALKNHLDASHAFESAYYGDMPNLITNISKLTGFNKRINKGVGKLETLGNVFGLDKILNINQHLALSDIKETSALLLSQIPGNKNGTYFFTEMLNRLKGIKANNNSVSFNATNYKETLLFANNGLELGNFDYVLGEDGVIKDYMQRGIKRNHFYEIEDISMINSSKIKNIMSNSPVQLDGATQNLFRISLKDASKETLNKETIVLHAESEEALKEIIESVFGIRQKSAIMQNVIEATTKKAVLDKARRAYQGMESLDGTRGFDYIDRLTTTYNDLNNAYTVAKEAQGITNKNPLTKKQIETLIRNRKNPKVTVGRVQLENVEQLLSPLGTVETMENFAAMYDVIKDQHKFLTGVVGTIKGVINPESTGTITTDREKWYEREVLNQKRTLALTNTLNEVDNGIVSQFSKDLEVANSITKQLMNLEYSAPQFGDLRTISLSLNGEIRRVDGSSAESLTNSLWRVANSVAKNEKDSLKNQVRAKTLHTIGLNLIKRGLFKGVTEEEFENIYSKIRDPYRLSTYISNGVYKAVNDLQSNLNEEDYYKTLNPEPLYIYSDKGRKVNGKRYDTVAKKIDYIGIAQKNAENSKAIVTSFDKYGVLDLKSKKLDPRIVSLLKEHGYSDRNIETLRDVATSKHHGYTGAKDLMFSIFEHTNEENEKELMIAIANTDYSYKIAEAISRNQIPNSAYIATAKLPTIEKVGPVNSVKYGSINKIISQKISVYESNDLLESINPLDVGIHTKLKASERDIVDLSFTEGLLKFYKNASTLLEKGQGALLGKRIQRGITNVLGNAMAFVGNENVRDIEGNLSKKLIPTQGDFIASNLVDVSEVVNFIPYLYKTLDDDNNIKQDINKLWKSNYNGKIYDADHNINRWIKQLEKGIKDGNELSIDQKSWFITNFLRDKKIAKAIVDNKGRLNANGAVDALEELLKSNPTQFIKDERTGKFYIIKGNPIHSVSMGEFNNPIRPLGNQQLQVHAIQNVSNFLKDETFMSQMRQRQFKFGPSVLTEDYLEYLNTMNRNNFDIENTITSNTLNITTDEVLDRIENRLNVDDIANETGYSKKQVEQMISRYKMISSTYEGHGLINPFLKKHFYNTPQTISQKVKNFELADKISKNKSIILNYNDIVGYQTINGNREAVRYLDDLPGRYQKTDRGRIYFEHLENDVNDAKLIANGAEKGIFSSGTGKAEFYSLDQYIFDKLFGKNIGTVTQMPLAHHESYGVNFGNILFKIADIAESKGPKEIKELQNYLNSHETLKKLKLRYIEDSRGTGRFVKVNDVDLGIEDKDLKNTDYVSAFLDLKDKYMGKDDYKEALSDENVFRTYAGKGQLSESYNAYDPNRPGTGNGVGLNPRYTQTAASTISDDIKDFYEFKDGHYTRKIEPFLETLKNRAKHVAGPHREVALNNIYNILGVIKENTGVKHSNNIADFHFDDFNIPVNGMDATDLRETIFSNKALNKLPDVYRIQLPDGVKLQSFFDDKKEITSILIPRMKLMEHDGIFHLSGTEKAIATLINSIADGKDNDIIQGHYNDYFKAMYKDLTDKDGILSRVLNFQRVEHSGIMLAQTVIPPVFKDGKFRLNDVYSGAIIDTIENGEVKRQYNDILFTTIDEFKAVGFDFKGVGKQLVDEQFRNDLAFANHLTKMRMLDANGGVIADYEQIAEEWLFERGIYGVDTRYPTFLNQSTMAVNIKASRNMGGRVGSVMYYTADKMNLDTDGDIQIAIHNIVNGKLPSVGSREEKILKDLVISQRKSNERIAKKLEEKYENVKNRTGKYTTDLRGMVKYSEEKLDRKGFANNSNFLHIDKAIQTAIYSKQAKSTIGYVSNPNFLARDAAQQVFTTSNIGMEHLGNIIGLTEFAEQNLIDTKHMSKLEENPSFKYFEGMQALASGEEESIEKGLTKLYESFKKSGFLTMNDEEAPAELKNILSGEGRTTLERSIISMGELFKDQRAREIYNGIYGQKKFIDKDIASTLTTIATNIDSLRGGKIANDMINATQEAINYGTLNKYNIDASNTFYTKDTLINGMKPGMYNVSNIGKGDNTGLSFVELKGEDENLFRLYGKDFDSIAFDLSKHFGVIGNKNINDVRINMINSLTKANVKESLINYNSIIENRIAAKVASTLNNSNFDSTIKEVIDSHQLNLDENSYNGLVERIRSKVSNLNALERQGLIGTLSAYSDNSYKEIKKAARYVEALKNKNQITAQQGTSFISQLNEQIMSKGLNSVKDSNAIENFVKQSLIRTDGSTNPVTYKMIENEARNIKYSYKTNGTYNSADEILNALSELEIIDTNKTEEMLRANYKNQIKNVASSVYNEYGVDKVDTILEDILVNDKLMDINKTNNINIALRGGLIENLININENKASEYLNWTNSTVLSEAGEAKIGFGNYAGIRIKDLSFSTLSMIQNVNTEDMDESTLNAVMKTKSQINNYLNAVDNLGEEDGILLDSIIHNASSSSTTGGKILGNIDFTGDLNEEIIRRATAKEGFAKEIVNKSGNLLKKAFSEENRFKTIGAIALGTVALGIAGNLLSPQYTADSNVLSPERRNNGTGSPSIDGAYDDINITRRHVAPPTPNTARVEENTGMKYSVSARLNSDINKDNLTNNLKNALVGRQNVNLNINTKDDKSKVSDSWLREKFSELLS